MKAKVKKPKIKIFERNAENDIRYRGPLSYRHFQILGWVAILFKVLNMLITAGERMLHNLPQIVLSFNEVAEVIGAFALPLFLFANFAILLDGKKSFKTQLIKFGALSFMVVFLFMLISEHNILELGAVILKDRAEAERLLNQSLEYVTMTGKLNFNLFIDMFLCTLLMFFLEYKPKKFFVGKKRYIFRAFALIPILYEAGSLLVRILMAYGVIEPRLIIYPLLTTKPPLSFAFFVIMVLFIKFREFRFRKHGYSKEDYKRFTKTNVNSLHFSIFASVMLVVTCLIDVVLFVLLVGKNMQGVEQFEGMTEELYQSYTEATMLIIQGWGIGTHRMMFWLIPLVLLFSYTRVHKNDKIDMLIPAGAILVTVVVSIETIHQGLVLKMPAVINALREIVQAFLG